MVVDAAADMLPAGPVRNTYRSWLARGGHRRLAVMMGAWREAGGLDRSMFRLLYLRPGTPDMIADGLREAAHGASDASEANEAGELISAAESLSRAILDIGINGLEQFIGDVERRATAAARTAREMGDIFGVKADGNRIIPIGHSPNSGHPAASRETLPAFGEASTYADRFVNNKTASGKIYRHDGYSAALLPRSRWTAVPLGTRLRLSYQGRSVVVEVSDVGAGNGRENRVLDLSRAAMAHLIWKAVNDITDRNSGVIQLERIEIVGPSVPLGPVSGMVR